MAKGKRKVVVRITSDVKGLKAGVFKADLTLKNFAKTSRAAANVAGKALAGGAAAAAAGLAAIYAKTAPLIAQQKDFAEQLNATTGEIVGLGYAAGQAGSSSETLNSALERMQRRVGLAAKDTGAAKNALKELGLEADVLASKGADEQFRIIADNIRQVEGASNQAAYAFEIFGNQGQELLQFMNQSADATDRAVQQAQRLGVALSDVDAEKVRAADDAFSRASEAAQGLMNRITVQLAPAIEVIADMFTEAADESEGFKDEVSTGFDVLVQAAALAANALHGMKVIWKGLELVAAGFTGVVASVFEVVGKVMVKSLDGWRLLINNWIEIANKIPGVDIDLIGDQGLKKANQFFSDVGESARENVGRVRGELHDLMMKPLPGDELKKKIEEVYATADEAARGASSSIGAGGDGGEQGMTDAEKARIEALRESLLTEEQSEIESHQRRLEEIEKFGEHLFENEAQQREAVQRLEEEHQSRLVDIRKKGMTELEKFNAMSWDAQAQQVTGSLVQMTQGVAQHSRKMFELNKAAGIANAVVSAYEGISKTMAAYPYPLNIGMAAAHAVSAFAQVKAIKNASFGSGGAPSQAAQPSTPVHNTSGGSARTGGSGGQSGGGQDVMINMRGEVFGRETVLGLIDGINEALADGAQIKNIKLATGG